MQTLLVDPFGTHRPTLVELIKNTTGNILECGCGNSSTVLIKDLIKGTDRKLVSLESNEEWLSKFKHMEDENHKMYFINCGNNDDDETGNAWVEFIKTNEYIQNLSFEVCFIDQSPWTARTKTLHYLKEKSKYIIVHDVDYFPGHKKWGTIKNRLHTNNNSLFKYEMDFSDVAKNYKVYYPPEHSFAGPTGPSTLLCSSIVNKKEFESMTKKINVEQYYKYYEPIGRPHFWAKET